MTARSSEPITEQLTYMSRHHITKSLGEAKGCNFSFCSTGISFCALCITIAIQHKTSKLQKEEWSSMYLYRKGPNSPCNHA